MITYQFTDFPGGSDGKSICLQCGKPRFNPWARKILWRRKWQPTPVLLPGKSHGRRSVVGYSPWGCRESDMTERLQFTSLLVSLLPTPCSHPLHAQLLESCTTLCNPMDCSLPGSSVHGIFQATILEWAAISFSRGSAQPRD